MIVASSSDYKDSLEHKLRCLISDGNTASEIANRLGMNEQVVRRKLVELGMGAPRATTRMPFGITRNSYSLRAALGMILTEMVEREVSQSEISEFTGLNRREIARAKDYPYSHDWKLSQIERTLQHEGKTLNDIS